MGFLHITGGLSIISSCNIPSMRSQCNGSTPSINFDSGPGTVANLLTFYRKRFFDNDAQLIDCLRGGLLYTISVLVTDLDVLLHSTAAIIFIVCFFAMSFVDTSAIYHMIRAQSVIKLYVMYNMLDVSLYIVFMHCLCVCDWNGCLR